MLIKQITIGLSCILLLAQIACHSQRTMKRGAMEIDIPKDENGKFELSYDLDRQKDKYLKLEDIQRGYDSIQIRIWFESMDNRRKLIVLKYRKNKWLGTYYYVYADWKYKTLRDSVTKYTYKNITPRSGWDVFTKGLLSHHILTLPDFRDIRDKRLSFADGLLCNVEVATKNKYRFYSYIYVPALADKYWQANDMFEAIDLIGRELNISVTQFNEDAVYETSTIR